MSFLEYTLDSIMLRVYNTKYQRYPQVHKYKREEERTYGFTEI